MRGTCPDCGEPITGRTPVDLVEAILAHSCRREDTLPPIAPTGRKHSWGIGL